MSKPTVAMCLVEIAKLNERIARLEEAARNARPARSMHTDSIRRAYFLAHPDAKSVTKADLEAWAAGMSPQ